MQDQLKLLAGNDESHQTSICNEETSKSDSVLKKVPITTSDVTLKNDNVKAQNDENKPNSMQNGQSCTKRNDTNLEAAVPTTSQTTAISTAASKVPSEILLNTRNKIIQQNALIKHKQGVIPGSSFLDVEGKDGSFKYGCQLCQVGLVSGPQIAKHLRDMSHLETLLASAGEFLCLDQNVAKVYKKLQTVKEMPIEGSKRLTISKIRSAYELSKCKKPSLQLHHRLLATFSEVILVTDSYSFPYLEHLQGYQVRVLSVAKMDNRSVKKLMKSQSRDSRRLWLLVYGLASICDVRSCFYCELSKCLTPIPKVTVFSGEKPVVDKEKLFRQWKETCGEFLGDTQFSDGSRVVILPLMPFRVIAETQHTHMELHRKQKPFFVAKANHISTLTSSYGALCQQFLSQMPSSLEPLKKFAIDCRMLPISGEDSVSRYSQDLAAVIDEVLQLKAGKSSSITQSLSASMKEVLVEGDYNHIVFLSNEFVISIMPGESNDPRFSKIITDRVDLETCRQILRTLTLRHGKILALIIPEISHLMKQIQCHLCTSGCCKHPIIYNVMHREDEYNRRLDAILESREDLVSAAGKMCHLVVTHFFPRLLVNMDSPLTKKEHKQIHDIALLEPNPLFIHELPSSRIRKLVNKNVDKHWEKLFGSKKLSKPIDNSLAVPFSYDLQETSASIGHWASLLKELIGHMHRVCKRSPTPPKIPPPQKNLKTRREDKKPAVKHSSRSKSPVKSIVPPKKSPLISVPIVDIGEKPVDSEPVGPLCSVMVWNVPPCVKSIYLFRMVTDIYSNAKVTTLSPQSYALELPYKEANVIFHAMKGFRAVHEHLDATFQGEKEPKWLSQETVEKTRKIFRQVLQINFKVIGEYVSNQYFNSLDLEVDLSTYKTQRCPQPGCTKGYVCDFYHSERDRRRNPWTHTYSDSLCGDVRGERRCMSEDVCPLSHNTMETRYLPTVYKMQICRANSCPNRSHCPCSHRGYVDTLFTPQWENLIFVGVDNVLPCLWNSLAALQRNPARKDTRILVLTACKTFRDVLNQALKYAPNADDIINRVIVLHEEELLYEMKTHPEILGDLELLIIDSLDVMLMQPSKAQRIFVFIKELKKIKDYARLAKIVVVSQEDHNISRVGKFLSCRLTRGVLHSAPKSRDRLLSSVSPASSLESRKRRLDSVESVPNQPIPKKPRLEAREVQKRRSVTPPRPQIVPMDNLISELSDHDDSKLASIGQNFKRERDAAEKEHKAEYGAYEQVPDIHPECEQQYEIFLRKFTSSDINPAKREEEWICFWKNFISEASAADWEAKLRVLRAKHLPKSSLAVQTFVEPYSVASTIDILENLKSKFGPFESALSQILKDARAAGPTTAAMFRVMADPNAADVLKMILFKLEKLRDSCDSAATKQVYRTASSYTKKLLEDANATAPALDIENIAHATSGKSVSFTIEVIKTALAYAGHPDASEHVVNQVYLEVCSHHFKLSEKL